MGSVLVDDLQVVGDVGKRRGLWVFVWGIEDLDLYRYFVVVVVIVSVILGAGDSLQEREKKRFLFREG